MRLEDIQISAVIVSSGHQVKVIVFIYNATRKATITRLKLYFFVFLLK